MLVQIILKNGLGVIERESREHMEAESSKILSLPRSTALPFHREMLEVQK
jgi:hypothetical protein